MSDTHEIVEELRDVAKAGLIEGLSNSRDKAIINEAAEMLQFVFDHMVPHALHMDGTAWWRMQGGWPLNMARGRTAEDAIRKCLEEIKKQGDRA